jgi:Glycosyltransferase Family 4
MLVFILASWYPSEAEPALGVFIEEQALALRRRHDVVVIAPERRSWRRTVLSGRASGLRIEQRRGLDVVRIRAGSPLPWSWRLRQAAYVRAARRAFDESARVFGNPDLLHAHVVLPGGDAALRIGRAANIPVVLTEHSGPFSMHLTDCAFR